MMDIGYMLNKPVRENGRRVLYMKTTLDQYELPIAIADSPAELARICGTSPGCVMSSIFHKRRSWHRIVLSEEESLELDIADARNGNFDAIEFLQQRKDGEHGRT